MGVLPYEAYKGNGPCSACGDGDTAMRYHNHDVQPKSYILDEIHNLANHYGDEYGFDDEELTVRLWLHRVVEAAGEGGWGDERET